MSKTYDSVAVFSGGLDSTTLVYHMLAEDMTPHLLSFDYGQRHRKELTFAKNTAMQLGLRHDIVDLSNITYLISNSALTSINHPPRSGKSPMTMIEVPEGHYAEDNMKATVVPNRNMIMAAIAAGVAVNNGYHTIGLGVHGGDHFVYPDCRPEFLMYLSRAIEEGNAGFHTFFEARALYTPFLNKTKADIAYRAIELKVPLHMTWSCYKGGDKHCGRCGTCVERLEATDEADQRAKTNRIIQDTLHSYDQTVYEDDEYWKVATK